MKFHQEVSLESVTMIINNQCYSFKCNKISQNHNTRNLTIKKMSNIIYFVSIYFLSKLLVNLKIKLWNLSYYTKHLKHENGQLIQNIIQNNSLVIDRNDCMLK